MGSHSSDGHKGDVDGCGQCAADYESNASMKPSREEMGLGPACFPYDTLIDTPYGKEKIGGLKKGQVILSYNAGKLVPRVITRKRVRGVEQIIRVEFSTGKTLLATGHHSFLTQSGWKKLADIRSGDKVIRSDASASTVQSITTQKVEPVFNIYTAGEHNFIANDCVAHNFTEFRALRTILHRLFLDGPTSVIGQVALQH